jgi:hypothetical protein
MITNRSFCHNDVVQSYRNSGIKLTKTSTPWEASHDAFSRHPPPTPAPSRAGSLQATHHQRHYLDQQISKAEYTNTQQDLPVGDNYFQL